MRVDSSICSSARVLSSLLLVVILLAHGARAQCPWNEGGVQAWSSPSTWPSNAVPVAGDSVVIPSGVKVVYDVTTPGVTFASITVQSGAQFIFDGTKNLFLETSWVWVQDGASFRIGSSTCPFSTKAIITLFGPRDTTISIDGKGNKGIICAGTLEFFGVPPSPTWSRVAATVKVNDTSFAVQDNVNWKVGDRVVLASTDYYQELSEDLTITAISGTTITVNRPIKYLHWGANNQYAEVGVINRNIVIQGDSSSDASFFGGHVLLYGNAIGKTVGVEYTKMGQQGVLGRYPFHYHYMGDQTGKGHIVSENSFHHNYQRCFTIHGTSGVTARNNVGFNVTGHCYFLEEGSETGNLYDHNLGVWVNPGPMIPTDKRPAIFWITNPNNTFTNNAAVGGNFGYWFSLPATPLGMSSGQTWVYPRSAPLGGFNNNVAHSASENGVHSDDMPYADGTTTLGSYSPLVNATDPNKVALTVYFYNILSYKNRGYGTWLRGSQFVVTNALLMDNAIGINFPANGNLVANSTIVGETPNIGTPGFTQWFNDLGRSRPKLWYTAYPIHGFEGYDNTGNQFARNVTFVNFTSDSVRKAGAISTIAHGIFILPANDALSQVTLINSNVWAQEDNVYFRDGPSHVVMHDSDGSLTGSYGSYVVSNNSILLFANNCTKKPEWNNFYLCQAPEDGYSQLTVSNQNTAACDFGASLNQTYRATFVPFGQSSVKDYITGGDPRYQIRDSYTANVISRKGYVLQFPHPTPPQLQVTLRFAATGEWVVVALTYPVSTTFTIVTGWANTPLTPVTSLSLLSPLTYYYSASQQYLYVMYFEADGGLTSPVGFPQYGWGDNYINIAASCGNKCSANGTQSIPSAYPDTEDKYKAALKGCVAGTSSAYKGVAYLRYNPKNKKLTYLIYHNIPQATTVTIQGSNGFVFTHPVAQSPIRGALDISWQKHNDLWNGNWSVVIGTGNSAETIKGNIGCVGTCSVPPKVSAFDPCAKISKEFVMYNDTLNSNDGWYDWSWGSTRQYNYSADYRCGTNSILAQLTGWGSVSLHVGIGSCNPGLCQYSWQKPFFNVSGYSYFQFNVKSPTGPLSTPFTVSVNDYADKPLGTPLSITFQYVDNYFVENQWTRVKIPLKDLGFVGTELVGKFSIYIPANVNIPVLFDDIRLVPSYTDPITKAPYGVVKAFAETC